MQKAISAFSVITILAIASLLTPSVAFAQRQGFINVEGPDLKARMEAAIKQGRAASNAGPFWTAYSFDVRPGVAVDGSFSRFEGNVTTFSDTSVAIGTSGGVTAETRNLGIFLLHDPATGSITRLEVYNLDRPREYSRYPVYWVGRAGNEESLNLLQGLVESSSAERIAEKATMALGLHDDRRVGAILKNFARASSNEKVRATSIFWLGQIGGEQAFLADIARNEQESVSVRKKAVFAIGVGKDAQAIATLKSIYAATTSREVKKQIIFAASINEGGTEGVEFLIKTATSDPDPEAKKQAIFWLGQKAGERSLQVLGDTANSSSADTEVQNQAVFAISRRPREEAVPLLIKIAKTHHNAEVRKQAMFWLSRTGDERALEFFRDVLLNK